MDAVGRGGNTPRANGDEEYRFQNSCKKRQFWRNRTRDLSIEAAAGARRITNQDETYTRNNGLRLRVDRLSSRERDCAVCVGPT